jgi:hypothetical protein
LLIKKCALPRSNSKSLHALNSEGRGRQAMRVGEFKAWSDFESDLGKAHFFINNLTKLGMMLKSSA